MIRTVTKDILTYDENLLAGDRYTFSVLTRILQGPCSKTITDDTTFLLCLSAKPYPVWVWTADDITEAGMEEVFRIVEEEWPEYHYNMKYKAADYFTKRGYQVSMNMMTYECPHPVAPVSVVGAPRLCTMEDLDVITDYYEAFVSEAIPEEQKSREELRQTCVEKIQDGTLYVWEDDGKITCMCGFHDQGRGLGSIGPVYTPPESRRKHYAEHLVYHVTRHIWDIGMMPILYTNADYAPSNNCYQKVGYELRGTLCTVNKAL